MLFTSRRTVIVLGLVFFSFTSLQAQSFETPADSIADLLKKGGTHDTTRINHLLDLGWMMMYQNPDTAIVMGEQALEMALTIHNSSEEQNMVSATRKGISRSHANLGVYYFLKGEFAVSLDNHYKALEIRDEMQDLQGLANTYNNIGLVFRFQGDYSNALDYYSRALKLYVELGIKDKIALNLGNIGLVYSDLGNGEKALEYYRFALELNKETGNKTNIANTLNNMGIVYYDQKNYQAAIVNFEHALAINKEIDRISEVANNLGNIGASFEELGRYTEAIKYYREALDINLSLGSSYGIIANKGNIGLIYLLEKNYSMAEQLLQEALELSEEKNALEFIKENNKNLSTLYDQTGNYKKSLDHYHRFTAAKDSLFNNEKNEEIARLEMQHEIERMEKDRELRKLEATKIADKKRKRKNILQYSGIFIGLLAIGLVITLLGLIKVSPKTARSITFFAFLLLFEFILVLVDPLINQYSKGEPIYILLINAGLAACIFPLHALLESRLNKRLVKKKG